MNHSSKNYDSEAGSKYLAAMIILLGAGGGIIYGVYYKGSDLYFAQAFALFGIIAVAAIAFIIHMIWTLLKDFF